MAKKSRRSEKIEEIWNPSWSLCVQQKLVDTIWQKEKKVKNVKRDCSHRSVCD